MSSFLKEFKNKDPKEKFFMFAGGLALLAAIAGVFVPIVPQVPFAILAAFLFSRGSRRLHKWTRENKYFGKPVKDWEDHQVIRPKLKIFSTLALIGAGAFGHYKMLLGWALGLDAILLASLAFILSRDSKPKRKK